MEVEGGRTLVVDMLAKYRFSALIADFINIEVDISCVMICW